MSRIEQEFVQFDRNGQWPYIYSKVKHDSATRYRESAIKDAKSPGNRTKNRYRDVSPYDHSRVRLKKNSLDYINASLVEVPVADRSYILTQGPLPSTSGHFWLMVWEQNSKAVLMLNRVIEKGQLKCHKYYPAGKEEGDEDEIVYEDVGIKVTYLSEEDCDHFTIRTLQLTDLETGADKEVLQFHYTTWPDFGVPHSPAAFLKFLAGVRGSGSLGPDVGPPVIHCSAGIGRSGTFCLVDSALVLIEENMSMDDIDIREMLLDMRQYRMGLIQTPDQLRFSYLAIIEAGREILGEILDSTFKTPMNRVPPPKPPRLQREYGVDDSMDTAANTNDITEALTSAVDDISNNTRSKDERVTENGEEPPPLPPRKRSHINANDEAFGNSPAGSTQNEPMDQGSEKRRKEQTEVRRRNREERLKHTTDQVDKMKRKQQQSEKWRRRRSLVKPVTLLGVALSACLVGYLIYYYVSRE